MRFLQEAWELDCEFIKHRLFTAVKRVDPNLKGNGFLVFEFLRLANLFLLSCATTVSN